jgi:hypothetical protein
VHSLLERRRVAHMRLVHVGKLEALQGQQFEDVPPAIPFEREQGAP